MENPLYKENYTDWFDGIQFRFDNGPNKFTNTFQLVVLKKVDFSTDFLNDYSARKCSLIGCYGVMRADILKKIGGMPYLGNSFCFYSDTLLPILLIE